MKFSPPNFLRFWQEIPNIDFHEIWNTKFIFYLLKNGNRSQKEEAKVGQMLKQSVLVCLRRLKFFNCSLRCSMDAIGQTDISVIESKLFISSSRESRKGASIRLHLCPSVRSPPKVWHGASQRTIKKFEFTKPHKYWLF